MYKAGSNPGQGKRYLFFFLSILLLSGLISKTYPLEQPKSKPFKLRVLSLPYLSFAPFFIAKEEGYYAEQGLQVEFVKMTQGVQAIPALIQGDLDVSGGNVYPGHLNAIARGARIKMVADKGFLSPHGCTSSAVMVRRTLLEGKRLERLSQLKGLRVGVFQGSTLTDYLFEKILLQAGLSLSDMEWIPISTTMRPDAFEKGTIDVSLITEPWITHIQRTGHAVIWKSVQQLLPEFQMAVLFYGPTILDQNMDAGKRFMVAYLKGVRAYLKGKTDRNIHIVGQYTGLDEFFLKTACWLPFRENGRINIASVRDYQSWAVKKGLLNREVSVQQFWDPRFIEEAEKILSAPKGN